MNKTYKNSLYLLFLLTILIISYELFTSIRYRLNLKDNFGINNKSYVYFLATQNPFEFIKSQRNASLQRILNVSIDLIKTVFLIFVSSIFLSKGLQKRGIIVADSNITLIKNGFRELKRSEINFICMLTGLFLLNKSVLDLMKSKHITLLRFFKSVITTLLTYLFLIPIVIFMIYIFIKTFGKMFIVACYLALIIKLLPEILIQDGVDSEKMKLVDIEKYPENIQNLLKENGLDKSVYEEIEKKSEKNAALVGYGKYKRLEIYGNFTELEENSLYSVLLHEIGHAKENTFMRKAFVYISLLLMEMLFVIFLYEKVSQKFSNETLSFFSAFLLLFLVYRMIMKQWLFAFYKVVSQKSEYNSDMFAKSNDYGKDLGDTLFNIVIDSNDYLIPTLFYNFLRSSHPPLYNRINYLGTS